MGEAKELSFSVPWGCISAKAWGCSNDSPVLCLHGLLDNAASFDRLIALLPKTHYYVSIDLPGMGLSLHFPSGIGLNFFNYVLTIRYVIETLKWKTFSCIGHSLGGHLAIFYSIIYPNQIEKLISIEGIPSITNSNNFIDEIRKSHDSVTISKDTWFTRDEVMYSLRCKRNFCLNTKAAEKLFNRAVTEFDGKFKYNRDIRLKTGLKPLLNIEQIINIFSKLNVKMLLFVSKSSMNSHQNSLVEASSFKETFKNIDLIFVQGNHDVHNNHPERLSYFISKFLHVDCFQSKL